MKRIYSRLQMLTILFLMAMLLSGCNQKKATYVSTTRQEFTVSGSTEGIPQSEVEKQGMQKIVSNYLLWPPISEKNFEENYTIKFNDEQEFYNAGLSDETIVAIEDSYSYYCNTNKVPTSDAELVSVVMNKDDGLCHTIINIAGTKLEQIVEVSSGYQRVDYIEGDDVMDKFGVLYVNMDASAKERTTNLFNRYVEEEDNVLYSMKEYNCCYYYFYIDHDGENRYIRVEKKTDEVVDDGLWDENGIIKKEEKTVYESGESE